MSPTAAFWIGFVTGDVVASIAILFVLALLHAGKRGDPSPLPARRGVTGAPSPSAGKGSPLTRSECGND